ncbi:MAG: outer membrane beta-barrel protein [Bacteroidia bacterium]
MKRFLIFCFLMVPLVAQARVSMRVADGGEPGKKNYGFTFSASSVISFNKVDLRHSLPARPRFGMGGSMRFSIYLSESFHLQTGLEVLSQGCSFETYYFAEGYSTLFDRSFGYVHRLRTYELYVPVLFRLGLAGTTSNAPMGLYVIGGWSPKLILAASTDIRNAGNGQGVWGGTTELEYENYFWGKQTGNVLMGGIGVEDRMGLKEKFVTYEINYRYNLSRIRYQGKFNTNDLMIKNSCVSLSVGMRF